MKSQILLFFMLLLSIFGLAQQPITNKGKLIAIEFRDSLPYEGVLIEEDIRSYYKEGNIVRKDSFDLNKNSLLTSEKYSNNILISKSYFFFQIFDDPKEIYEGKYKDEKPWDGYFLEKYVNEDLDVIPLISFYDNGIIKYRYTSHLFSSEDDFGRVILDKKATFVNDNILEGFEYTHKTRDALLGVGYSESVPNHLELNLFGMHYFNQFKVSLQIDELEFKELRSGVTIKATHVNGANYVEVINAEGKKLQDSESYYVKEGSPNSITKYLSRNHQLISVFFNGNQLFDLNQKVVGRIDKVTMLVYLYLLNHPMQSLTDVFKTLHQEFLRNDINDYFVPIETSAVDDYVLCNVHYDENGQLYWGAVVEEVENGFEVKFYDDGKLKETRLAKNLEEVRTITNILFVD